MDRAIDQFRLCMERVHQLGGLYHALTSLTTKVLDPSDLLRAQLVLAVSALDFYVHEITVLGMLEVYDDQREETPTYSNLKVPASFIAKSSATVPVINGGEFERFVRDKNGYLSFQQPDKIADAIRHFSSASLWKDVSLVLNEKEKDIKETLKLIVDRRNKIAHEADIDPTYTGSRWPITANDVEGSVSFISRLCEAIHVVVK
jgi:hypothetical protein